MGPPPAPVEVALTAPSAVSAAPQVVPAASAATHRSIKPIVLPAVVGGATFLLSWVGTFVSTTVMFFDGRECHGGELSLFGGSTPLVCNYDGPTPDGLGASFIPIAGPWIMLNTPNVDPAYAITMGVVQAAGLLTIAIGVPLGIVNVAQGPDEPGVSVAVSPTEGGATLTLDGRF
jgi:hypothetical protein